MSFSCPNTVVFNGLNPSYYHVFSKGEAFFVKEDANEGKAELLLKSSYDGLNYLLNKRVFEVFNQKHCADSLVIEDDDEKTISIIEIKKTIKYDSWNCIKEQVEGALYQSEVISRMLGFVSSKRQVLVMYLNDKFKESKDSNYIHIHNQLAFPSKARTEDWEGASSLFYNGFGTMPLIKIKANSFEDMFVAEYNLS